MPSESPPQPPPKRIAASDILPTMQRIMDEYRQARDTVCKQADPCGFENTILPILEVENRTSGEYTMAALMRYCAPDPQSRAASEAAVKLATEASAERNARQDLFAVFDAVQKKGEILEPDAQRHLEQLCDKYKRSERGALDDQAMEQYLDSHKTIKELCQQYSRNIMDNDDGLWVPAKDLDGIPKTYIERFFSNRSSENNLFIPFQRQEGDVFLQYAENPSARRLYYTARSRQYKENIDIFRDVIITRHRCANILGYTNHAEFKLEYRMIKSAESINEFLDYIENALLEKGKAEMDSLVAQRETYFQSSPYTDDYPNCMPAWDLSFFSRLEEESLDIDQRKYSEYFALDLVISDLLQTITDCLGLQFERLTAEEIADTTWHEDVIGWAVWEEKGGLDSDQGRSFAGYLFMDLLARENKYKGSQNPSLQSSFLKPDGVRVYPSSLIMCSFSRPLSDGPTLLTQDNIVSLFHECGHALHDLLSRTKYSCFHGWNSPPDFNEVPSLLFEHWIWMKRTLEKMNKHYTTLSPKYLEQWKRENPGRPTPPAKLSDADLQHLISSRRQGMVSWYLAQLAYSRFDLALHGCRSLDECLALDPADLYYRCMEKYRFVSHPDIADRGYPQANFRHLLKGHDAGLHTYMLAHVAAINIYETIFAADPFSREAWNKYRYNLLALGSSQDEATVLEGLLGGPPKVHALVSWLDKQ